MMSSTVTRFTVMVLSISVLTPAMTDCPGCPEDASCNSENKCECNKGFVGDSLQEPTKCLPYATEYHAECEINAQCEWMGEHSECKSYTCMCEDGFRWLKGECKRFAGLGEDCSDPSECYDGYNLQSLTCKEKKCTCSGDYYLRNGIDCRKIAKKEGDSCALDADCQFVSGVCILGKCQTRTETEKQHLPFEVEEIEETYRFRSIDVTMTCSSDDDCKKIRNSECFQITGTCICKHGYFFETDGSTCLAEIGVATANLCKEDKDCPIKPGRCDKATGTCYCRDYYFVEDGNRNCIKTMSQGNWNCLSKEWCYALGPYSYCNSSETCQCSRIAKLIDDNTVCEKTHEDPEICMFDFDCGDKIKNSFCIDEACQCRGNYRKETYKHVDTCMPNIGSPCDLKELPCTLENSVCQSDDEDEILTCQCKEKYVTSQSVNNTKCYPVSQNLGEDCVVDEQCSFNFPHTQCDGKCACAEDYVARENVCYEIKKYGSYCTDLLQCTVSLGDTFKCRNSKCQCSTDDILEGGKCVSSGRMVSGSLTSITYSIILTLAVVLR